MIDNLLYKIWVIGAERNEDGLFVQELGLESQRHLVCSVEYILVKSVKVGVVLDGSIHESGSVCI